MASIQQASRFFLVVLVTCGLTGCGYVSGRPRTVVIQVHDASAHPIPGALVEVHLLCLTRAFAADDLGIVRFPYRVAGCRNFFDRREGYLDISKDGFLPGKIWLRWPDINRDLPNNCLTTELVLVKKP